MADFTRTDGSRKVEIILSQPMTDMMAQAMLEYKMFQDKEMSKADWEVKKNDYIARFQALDGNFSNFSVATTA